MGDSSEVDRLLIYGANINCTDMFGYTPLHWAAMKSRVEILTLLINKGAILDQKCLNYSFTALPTIVLVQMSFIRGNGQQ